MDYAIVQFYLLAIVDIQISKVTGILKLGYQYYLHWLGLYIHLFHVITSPLLIFPGSYWTDRYLRIEV